LPRGFPSWVNKPADEGGAGLTNINVYTFRGDFSDRPVFVFNPSKYQTSVGINITENGIDIIPGYEVTLIAPERRWPLALTNFVDWVDERLGGGD
jgi:hypothetical protein